MRLLILLVVCVFVGCQKKTKNTVDLIKLSDISTEELIVPKCLDMDRHFLLKVENHNDNDTIFIRKPNYLNSGCLPYDRVSYYGFINSDSIELKRVGIGDSFGKSNYDMVTEGSPVYYVFDYEFSKYSLSRNTEISFAQFSYSFGKAEHEKRIEKILLYYNMKLDTLLKMDFTIPINIDKFRLPNKFDR